MTFEAPSEPFIQQTNKHTKTSPPRTSQKPLLFTKPKEVWVMALIPPLNKNIRQRLRREAGRTPRAQVHAHARGRARMCPLVFVPVGTPSKKK